MVTTLGFIAVLQAVTLTAANNGLFGARVVATLQSGPLALGLATPETVDGFLTLAVSVWFAVCISGSTFVDSVFLSTLLVPQNFDVVTQKHHPF